MTYADAARRIAEDYKRRTNEYRQAEIDCFASDAEFARSESKLRDLFLRKAKGEKIDSDELEKEETENKKIRARLGLVPPTPHCNRCNDTGRAEGKYCDCAVKLAISSQSGEIGIPVHSFADVDYSVYGDCAQEYRKLFRFVDIICSSYPDNKKRCMYISGGTGNGKTYLAGCAAQKALERGLSVMALTAFAANSRFLKYHTTFDENKSSHLEPMIDCNLLIIDDLGTESILKNVTLEYLYQVINERNLTGKLTLVTTNLTPNQFLARYGDRIYSRVFDKSLSLAISLRGKDMRV